MSAASAGRAEPRLELILGRCDSLRAEVYLRATLPPGVDPAAAVLTGSLTGPECRRAVTLPATAGLIPLPMTDSADGRAVARALVTEPAPWTPELPQLYRLEAGLELAGREVFVWRRRIGLRRLGVRGRSLWLDGRRYVPRAVAVDAAGIDFTALAAAGLAAAVADPAEEFLERADAAGVAVVATLEGGAGPAWVTASSERLRRWAWHPAVLLAVVPRGISTGDASALVVGTAGGRDTMLLAIAVDGAAAEGVEQPAFDVVLAELPAGGLPGEGWRASPPPGPLVARRGGRPAEPPSRRPCDDLQADLASWGVQGPAAAFPDWAGYVVG